MRALCFIGRASDSRRLARAYPSYRNVLPDASPEAIDLKRAMSPSLRQSLPTSMAVPYHDPSPKPLRHPCQRIDPTQSIPATMVSKIAIAATSVALCPSPQIIWPLSMECAHCAVCITIACPAFLWRETHPPPPCTGIGQPQCSANVGGVPSSPRCGANARSHARVGAKCSESAGIVSLLWRRLAGRIVEKDELISLAGRLMPSRHGRLTMLRIGQFLSLHVRVTWLRPRPPVHRLGSVARKPFFASAQRDLRRPGPDRD